MEAALVMPLFALLMLGSVDLGMWVFQTTQAASAARSGARVGILRYRQADQAGSADAAAVRAAVARDAGSQNLITVMIRCVGPASTVALLTGCQGASVVSPDRILVTVVWRRPSATFLTAPFGTQTVSATAVMVINGRPPAVQQ